MKWQNHQSRQRWNKIIIMWILYLIAACVIIGLITGIIGNAKAKSELESEYAAIDERNELNKTSPPYKVGDLYYFDHHWNGMVISTNGYSGRYMSFSFFYDDMESKFKKHHIEIPRGSISVVKSIIESNEYMAKTEILPSVEELETFGRYYERFLELGKYYCYSFEDFRNKEYSDKILSRTFTPDGKYVYVYDLRNRRVQTVDVSSYLYSNYGEVYMHNF